METFEPIEPRQRVEILDILRGFALLGIIFNNIQYLSGYAFTPFDTLRQIVNFPLNEKLHDVLDIIITAKFYTLFSFLFATGFYIQLSRHAHDSNEFLKTYRRRLFILLILGTFHSLIWFGDILFSYAIIGFLLIPFRAVKPRKILIWAISMLIFPYVLDIVLWPFFQSSTAAGIQTVAPVVHASYPDLSPDAVIHTFQHGSLADVFLLNFHNLVWKYLGYFPSGQYFTLFGIFLLGFYLASTGFFTHTSKPVVLLLASLCIGLLATFSARMLHGSLYRWPPTPQNALYKFLLLTGQLGLCIFYITLLYSIFETNIGKRILKLLIPMGRMALSNYLLQTIIMIIIFYPFGFKLFGKTGLFIPACIAISILVIQIIFSTLWLKRFKFGPFEWLWRSLTYKKWIKMRNVVVG
jgi:uncharacterized protein